jgi:hypothetical protein
MKYYTPEIEEFHVGFEVTYNHFNKRIIHVIKEDELNYGDYQGVTDFYEIIKNEPLVKYLDKKDIESLGFSYYKTHPGMEQMEFDKGEYELTYDPNFKGKQWLRINLEGEGDVTLFSGSIKNKSELKKLLKQLNIK